MIAPARAIGAAAPVSETRSALTGRELGMLLGLTALPVALTTAAMRLLAVMGALAVVTARLNTAYIAFLVYALGNWATFALVLAIAGRARLRRYGLRLALDARRCGAAVAAFVAGLVVYGTVTATLRAMGLPPMRGMDYPRPGGLEIALLLACAVVTAGFCEEVLFRVVWIGALRERVPGWVACAASLAAFAAIHWPYFGVGGVVFISAWALLPIVLFLRFGDVSASLGMHVLNNAFAYVVVPVLLR